MLSRPRFALLQHDHPIGHWDVLLEDNDKLLAWRLERKPTPGHLINTMKLPDHRLVYLDYEGPVSQNRGNVFREDRGEYQLLESGLGEIRLNIRGAWLTGKITLFDSAENSSFLWIA